MHKVQGTGGFFFRATDPAALSEWYRLHLGIGPAPGEAATDAWPQQAGPTVFAPFAADSPYFSADKQWMLNLRVGDLAAMVEQLRAAGITVAEPETYPYGSFARLHDPEGNAIELWQPA